MAFAPTPEQEAICGASGRIVKANAFAGTGKSSTLKHLARTFPGQRFLYIAFNKAIKEEAVATFPSNVKAMTGHGLAYASKGRLYGDVPNKLQGDLKPFHILPILHSAGSLRSLPTEVVNLYGGRVVETVKAYLVSSAAEPSLGHVSLGDSPAERKYMSAVGILADAKRVWADMCDLAGATPMLHDGYLKLYQLSEPTLRYDAVLVDEAQDTNPVLQAIVEAQRTRIFLIGDTHQAIYSFRGAHNAMELMKCDESFGLTGSFRFGPKLAEIANSILALKGESLALRGLGASTIEREIDVDREGHALVSRGNGALFRAAVKALDAERPFAFVGPLSNYRHDLVVDTYNLMVGDTVRDAFLRSFSTFNELAEYGESMNDREVKSRVKLAVEYGDRIPELVEAIATKSIPWTDGIQARLPANAVTLTTAHKSKGLEFPNVVLSDDYMELIDDEGELWDYGAATASDIEEVNLQYVAVTRAQHAIQLSSGLRDYLELKQQMDETSRVRLAG
ncbi:UvrD-helicase domain-containing protein [Pseudoxanthomonas kaohsiungensis]|uniref:DNA 3'-5' helicase n=1 Tax=Pseudoxanthomonas kaohsiungensis TaxID=283923 RepID=A0ABW3LYQ2_9GAMM|nr:UvrD-helicase domain-containing protein [Pseudoxanthomonas kaohsiungensis]KAF1702946.1 DNA helicase [Pseudoxanthomonas kaohsiungensis]